MSNKKFHFQVPPSMPAPNVLHLRPSDEGEVLPHGGVTLSYILYQDRMDVYAIVGLAMCNEYENFQKSEGVKRSGFRYLALLRAIEQAGSVSALLHATDSLPDMTVIFPVTKLNELVDDSGTQLLASSFKLNADNVLEVVPYEKVAYQYLFVKESDVSLVETISEKSIDFLRGYRESTYEGDNDDVVSDIEDTVVFILGGDTDGDNDFSADADESEESVEVGN